MNWNSRSIKYAVSWVHHKTAIRKQDKWVNTNLDVRIKNKVEVWPKGVWFYNADVEWYFSTKYDMEKNNNVIVQDQKWWEKKCICFLI